MFVMAAVNHQRDVTLRSVPCNRRVAGLNLHQATAQCSPTIACEEGNRKPPHSSHHEVA